MNAHEIAIYAIETRAIIYLLWGVSLSAVSGIVFLVIIYVSLRIKHRNLRIAYSGQSRQYKSMALDVEHGRAEINRLNDVIARHMEAEPLLKQRAERAEKIRQRTEDRLVLQNKDMIKQTQTMADLRRHIATLQDLIAYIDLPLVDDQTEPATLPLDKP